MTHCNSTAYIVVDGREVGMLACELDEGHHDDRRLHPLGGIIDEVDYPDAMREYDARVTEPHRQDAWPILPGTPHARTLTWADVTPDDIDEAFDPDEAFDLEVDIAPAEVIEHQARVTADAEPVEPAPGADYDESGWCVRWGCAREHKLGDGRHTDNTGYPFD